MIVYIFDGHEVKYWICMNHGYPVIGAKCRAARFDNHIIESALRQIKTLYPLLQVAAMEEGVRFKRPAIATIKKEF